MSNSASSEAILRTPLRVQTGVLLALLAAVPLLRAGAVPMLVGLGLLLVVTPLRARTGWPAWMPWAAGAFLIAPAWAVVQALPLTDVAHPLWRAAEQGGAISADPLASLRGALVLVGLGVAFLIAFARARRGAGAAVLVRGLAAIAAAHAALALAEHWLAPWTRAAYGDVLALPFVNRNGAAFFYGLGMMTSAVWLLRAQRTIGRRLAWPLLALVLTTAACLETESRVGILSAVAGTVGLCVLVALVRGRRLVLPVVLALGLLVTTGGAGVAGRLAATEGLDRAPVHAATVHGIAQRPWLGHGLGAFDAAFPMVRPPEVVGHWDRAHSLWLESLFELGIPAGFAPFVAVGMVVAVCLQALKQRRRAEYAALGAAAAFAAGMHGLVDFAPQLLPNALWLAVLLGLAAAQSWRATSASGRSISSLR